MVDVFISYSRTDKEKVGRLAKAIEAEGYAVWWDAELPPHQSYGEVITTKIESAKAALVVWSPAAAASEWVRAEADTARNQKKLIQTSLGDIIPPLPFNQIQCADLGDWDGSSDHSGWNRVKESLRILCGEREAKPAPVAPPVATVTTPAAPATAKADTPAHPTVAPAAIPAAAGNKPNNLPLLGGLFIGGMGLTAAAWMAFGNSAEKPGQEFDTTPSTLSSDNGFLNPEVPTVQGKPGDANPANQGQASDFNNRDVVLVNTTAQTIMYLFWSNSQDGQWGEDRLGSDVFPQGDRWEVTVDDGSGACEFDFMARLADGRDVVRSGINVCTAWEISFN